MALAAGEGAAGVLLTLLTAPFSLLFLAGPALIPVEDEGPARRRHRTCHPHHATNILRSRRFAHGPTASGEGSCGGVRRDRGRTAGGRPSGPRPRRLGAALPRSGTRPHSARGDRSPRRRAGRFLTGRALELVVGRARRCFTATTTTSPCGSSRVTRRGTPAVGSVVRERSRRVVSVASFGYVSPLTPVTPLLSLSPRGWLAYTGAPVLPERMSASATSHDRPRYATPTRVDVTECRTNRIADRARLNRVPRTGQRGPPRTPRRAHVPRDDPAE